MGRNLAVPPKFGIIQIIEHTLIKPRNAGKTDCPRFLKSEQPAPAPKFTLTMP